MKQLQISTFSVKAVDDAEVENQNESVQQTLDTKGKFTEKERYIILKFSLFAPILRTNQYHVETCKMLVS